MTLRLLFIALFGLSAVSCSGNKQQGVATPPPTQKTTEPANSEMDDQVVNEDDPFAGMNDEDAADEEIDDPADVDVPVSTDISKDTSGGGASALLSMLPLITGLMSGQMPDIGSLLSMFAGGASGGGGGALGGLSGLLGGTP